MTTTGAANASTEVLRELEDPASGTTPERAQELGRERTQLERSSARSTSCARASTDAGELLDLAESESDEARREPSRRDVERLEGDDRKLEFQRMFPGEMDSHNAFLDIQAGAGGTEAQDWAQMLLRMYLRWGDARGFKTEVIDSSPGEVAGIKSATIELQGRLRLRLAAHRDRRASPGAQVAVRFGNARATPRSRRCSCRPRSTTTSTSRSIRRTSRWTCTARAAPAASTSTRPSRRCASRTCRRGIVVACQNERSQHKNRSTAMKMLKAKLYELEVNKRNAAAKVLEDSKSDVSWGNQIRSYVLDQSRIKDLRTGVEIGNTRRCSMGISIRFSKRA